MSLYHDPKWPRASAWVAGECALHPIGRLAVIGAPLRLGSITPGRTDLAPRAIRTALERYSPFDTENARDLRELAARDYGDLPLAATEPARALEPVSQAVAAALGDTSAVVVFGGDNSVTRPAVHGLRAPLGRCGLLTFDAHFDLRDLELGLTNGNPVRALLGDGLRGVNVIQIGIQAFANSRAYAEVAHHAGITVITAEQVHERGIDAVTAEALDNLGSRTDGLYVDLDLDVLDRAFAPAAPGSRPGGLTPWQLRRAARACGVHPKVRALDLVEIDPEQDVGGATSLAAAACFLAFASGLHERLGGRRA